MQTHLGVDNSLSSSSALLSLLGEGAPSSKGNLCPAFRFIVGGRRTLPVSIDSQWPLAKIFLMPKRLWGWHILISFK